MPSLALKSTVVFSGEKDEPQREQGFLQGSAALQSAFTDKSNHIHVTQSSCLQQPHNDSLKITRPLKINKNEPTNIQNILNGN